MPASKKNNKIFYFCFVDSTYLYIYNPVTLARTYKIEHEVRNIDAYTSKALMTSDGRFFVTGSLHRPKYFTYEFSFDKIKFVSRTNMINGRCLHSFIEYKQNFLIVVGGCYGFQSLTECEYYDAVKNRWFPMSSLRKGRYYHVCLLFEGNILYAAGGRQSNYSSHIAFERIELDSKFNGSWREIHMNPPYLNSPLNGQGFLRLNRDEYLLFGGVDAKNEDVAECRIFNDNEKTISEADYKLVINDNFDGTSISYFHNGKFYIFSLLQNLHAFDGNRWQVRKNFIK